jgi:hypothetical protein
MLHWQEGREQVKQFARCTNCRQWYLHTFTDIVETRQEERLRRVTVWCRRCIDEAEQRSQGTTTSEAAIREAAPQQMVSPDRTSAAPPEAVEVAQLVQEHMELMERALHDDDDVLIPIIRDFMQRCQDYQHQSKATEATQRLDKHLHYWEAFLRAFHQAT